MKTKTTVHAQQRMSQRGINREMVELVLNYGRIEQDRYIIGRKEAQTLLCSFQRMEKELKKVLDKGGVVVVAKDDALITTYRCDHGH
jgi:RNase P protein component